MKNYLLTALLLVTAFASYAEETVLKPQFGLRLYSSFTWEPAGTFNEPLYQLGRLSPAFAIYTDKGHFHELGIDKLNFRNTDPAVSAPGTFGFGSNELTIRTNEVAWHYEYGHSILEKLTPENVSLVLGTKVSHAMGAYSENGSVSVTTGPRKLRVNQVQLGISPRLGYQVSRRVALELSYTKMLMSWHQGYIVADAYVNGRGHVTTKLSGLPQNRELRASVLVHI